jgi:hypothetical protein
MSVVEIEAAIVQLPPKEVSDLTSWLVDYHHHVWDAQIGADLDAGKLDKLLAEVEREYEAGLSNPL